MAAERREREQPTWLEPLQVALVEALPRLYGEAVDGAVAGLIGMGFAGVSEWHWQHAVWLLPVGVFASLGQLCMTRAYSQGATLVVANLQYSGIVFAALYSLLLFGDDIPLVGWAGMALIVVSGMTATLLRARAAPNAPAEEH